MLTEEIKMEDKEYKTERYSLSKDGKTYEVSCKEITNGFIVCIYESWYEGEGDKKEYKSKSTETYYKENPFGNSMVKEEKEDTMDIVKGLQSFMNKQSPLNTYK
jgi:hypothetical protein